MIYDSDNDSYISDGGDAMANCPKRKKLCSGKSLTTTTTKGVRNVGVANLISTSKGTRQD